MNKILVLTSGGIDSTVLLYKAIAEVGKSNVYMLNMYYGQKHDIEIEQARWQAHHLNLEDHYIEKDISTVFRGLENASALLKGSAKEISHKSYAEQLKDSDVVSAYVPYRNGIFLSIAAGIAYSLDCDAVAYGAHADDAIRREKGSAAYPDTTSEFYEAQCAAVREGTDGKVTVWAPLLNLTKAQVVMEGVEALMTREEFSHTHSCYEGVPGGCGTCGTCIKEGSKVLMSNWTLKPIEQLVPGDTIFSATEDGELTIANVTEVIDKGTQNVVQLGPLTLTPDHRVYRKARNHRPAGFVPVAEWCDGDSYKEFSPCTISDMHEYTLGYLRGLIDGDGSYSRGVFLCQNDETLLQEYVQLYNDHIAPTTMKPYYDEARGIYVVGGGTRTTFDEATSWEEHKYNIDYLLGYLNGIIISDGCINQQRGSVKVTIMQSLEVNKDVCDNILYALDNCDIRYSTWSSRCGGFRAEGALMLGIVFHRCYNVPLVYGTLKKEKAMQLYFTHYKLVNTTSFLSVPVQVEPADEDTAHVYDINTSTGTFFCEGVWVHNCRDARAALDANDYTRGVIQDGKSF